MSLNCAELKHDELQLQRYEIAQSFLTFLTSLLYFMVLSPKREYECWRISCS